MYYKKGIFENVEYKRAIIQNIEKDYLTGKTIKEIAENYSFSPRQVRYIIEHYIKINRKDYKNKQRKEKFMITEEVVKIDDDNYLVGDKPARKATINDLVEKAKVAKKEMKKKNSTNKKVENNN